MKTNPAIFLLMLSVCCASGKSPIQLSGRLESASFSADGVTFVISGTLVVDEFVREGSGRTPRDRITFPLNHVSVTATKYAVLTSRQGDYRRQDPNAFESLVQVCRDDGHLVRGGVAGLSITFSEYGEVELVAIRELSLIDSTVLDELEAICGARASAGRLIGRIAHGSWSRPSWPGAGTCPMRPDLRASWPGRTITWLSDERPFSASTNADGGLRGRIERLIAESARLRAEAAQLNRQAWLLHGRIEANVEAAGHSETKTRSGAPLGGDDVGVA